MKKQSGLLRRSIILALLLLCILAALTVVSFAADIVASGYCGGEGDGKNLTWTLDSEGVLTISGTGIMGDYNFLWTSSKVKKAIIESGVTSIGDYSFRGCGSLSSITIPDSVTSIGYGVFESCKSLTNVKLSACLTSIGEYAFSGCSGLTDITIPASVSSIGIGAFNNCSNASSIRVVAGNTVYDSRNNCNAIIETQTNKLILGCKNTVIPNTVTCIGDRSFVQCDALERLVIPGNIERIESYAFCMCTNLTEIVISEGVISIGKSAFSRCSSLIEITLPASLTSIKDDTFSDCYNLSSIRVAAGNKTYDSRNNCNAVIETESDTLVLGCQNTVIPSSVASIGTYAFYGCTGLTSIDIPSGVTSIGSCAFINCNNLAHVSIPNSVTSIGESAFSRCYALTSVVIPASVTSIGDMAFSWCKLDDAFFCGNAPEMKYDVFNGVDQNTFTVRYIFGATGWTDGTAYNAARGTWNGYKLALWDGQSVQIQQATPQSVTIHVQNKEEAYVYAAIYENGRFVKTVCKLVPVNAGEVTLALGMDELPEGAVIKAFVLAADGKTPLAKNAVWTVCYFSANS